MSFLDHPLLENKAIDMPCLVVDLGEIQAMTPAMSVAEVVTGLKPKALRDAPTWLIGEVIWRERAVPVIDVCQIALEKPTQCTEDEPLIVFNSAGGSDHFKFFAVRAARVPSLVRIIPSDVEAIDNLALPGMKIAIRHAENTYWVPDPVELEQHWVKYVGLLTSRES